jgi:hypothetical protein
MQLKHLFLGILGLCIFAQSCLHAEAIVGEEEFVEERRLRLWSAQTHRNSVPVGARCRPDGSIVDANLRLNRINFQCKSTPYISKSYRGVRCPVCITRCLYKRFDYEASSSGR